MLMAMKLNGMILVVPRYITACELAQHPLHLQRLGQRSRRGTAEVPSHHPQAQGQRASGGAEPKPPQSPTSRYRRRSRSSPTQPHTSSTSRRASRGPTKVTTCPGGGVDTGNATTQAPCGVSHTSRLAFELAIKLFQADFGIESESPNETNSLVSARGPRPLPTRTHRHPLTTSHGLRGPQTHDARLSRIA